MRRDSTFRWDLNLIFHCKISYISHFYPRSNFLLITPFGYWFVFVLASILPEIIKTMKGHIVFMILTLKFFRRCTSVSYGLWKCLIFDLSHNSKIMFYLIPCSSLNFSGPPTHVALLHDGTNSRVTLVLLCGSPCLFLPRKPNFAHRWVFKSFFTFLATKRSRFYYHFVCPSVGLSHHRQRCFLVLVYLL